MHIDSHAGTIRVLIQRFNNQRLARMLGLQQRLAEGQRLSDQDVYMLKHAIEDFYSLMPFLDRSPSYQKLAARVIALYGDIIQQGLKNESCR